MVPSHCLLHCHVSALFPLPPPFLLPSTHPFIPLPIYPLFSSWWLILRLVRRKLWHRHTDTHLCVCTVRVYFHCHPQLIAHPLPTTSYSSRRKSNGPEQNNGRRNDAAESFICLRPEHVPHAFHLTHQPWLMVHPHHFPIYITSVTSLC